ncbi:MAG: hypothetical protein KDD36_13365 [Flavobacteriales bacterium]|nr:hypothetical protein [Flavobacteriales bacterium]
MKQKRINTLLAVAVIIVASAFTYSSRTSVNSHKEIDLCANLTKIIESGKAGFTDVRGEKSSKKISGKDRPFDLCKVELSEEFKGYISMSASYPTYEVFFATDEWAKITEKLKSAYEEVNGKMKACLPESAWTIEEKDASNDSYLEGTDFKKTIFTEKVGNSAGKKIRMELFMYRHGSENKRVVELKIEGFAAPTE